MQTRPELIDDFKLAAQELAEDFLRDGVEPGGDMLEHMMNAIMDAKACVGRVPA